MTATLQTHLKVKLILSFKLQKLGKHDLPNNALILLALSFS